MVHIDYGIHPLLLQYAVPHPSGGFANPEPATQASGAKVSGARPPSCAMDPAIALWSISAGFLFTRLYSEDNVGSLQGCLQALGYDLNERTKIINMSAKPSLSSVNPSFILRQGSMRAFDMLC